MSGEPLGIEYLKHVARNFKVSKDVIAGALQEAKLGLFVRPQTELDVKRRPRSAGLRMVAWWAGWAVDGWVGESATLETDTGWLKGGERRSASDRQSKKRVGMVRREQEEGRTSQRQDRKRLWSVESQLGAGEAVLPHSQGKTST